MEQEVFVSYRKQNTFHLITMSAGKKFIRAVIEQGDPKALRAAKADWFTEDEEKQYTVTLEHLTYYGLLPTSEVLLTEGVPLVEGSSDASADYYLGLLRKRYAYNAVNTRHPKLIECMKHKDFDGLIDTLREMTLEAASVLDHDKYVKLSDELEAVVQEYKEAKFNPDMSGIPFGWPTLDLATSGAQGGDLIVVAGRPSLGKSWMLLNMARSAWLSGKKVCFTSMEMSLRQIARRWLGLHMRVNPNYIKEGELSTMGEERMMAAVDEISEAVPVHLLAGDMSKSVSGIENMAMEYDPDIIFVDSAYLMTPSGAKRGYIARWEVISEVVRQLKSLALRLDKPIVISVQFNRNQKNSSSGEQDLGDIAGSDSIPQDASIVLGLQKGPAPNQDLQRIISCMKNREGDTPQFATSFTFEPVLFKEVPLLDPTSEEALAENYDSEWME